MTQAELFRRAETAIGKSFAEMPCYRLLEYLLPGFPPATLEPIGREWLQVGDVVSFGPDPGDFDAAIGVYLGSGKVIVSLPSHGVCLVPLAFVRKQFLWGGRCG